jgi:hypothetical protein
MRAEGLGLNRFQKLRFAIRYGIKAGSIMLEYIVNSSMKKQIATLSWLSPLATEDERSKLYDTLSTSTLA